MKPIKLALRIWITITSLLSFLAGWALLSHAPKPASLFVSSQSSAASASVSSAIVPLPTLQPVPSLSSMLADPNATANIQTLPSFQTNNSNSNLISPSFRTRAS